MDYHFNYALTEEEYLEYNVYTVWQAPWQKKKKVSFLVKQFIYLAIVVSATLFFLSRTGQPRKDHLVSDIIAGTAIVLIITAISFYQIPNRIKNRARRFIQKEENIHLLFEQNLEINDLGITCTDKMSSTRQGWNSIVRYAATKKIFYLYINSAQALMIPKRLFTSQREIEEFDKFIAEKIPLTSSFRSMGI